MKGDGAAIPSSRFLRCREQPLITLCSHASPPPPTAPALAAQPIAAGAASLAGLWRGQGCWDVRAARNVPSDSPRSLIEVRAAPSVCPRQQGSPPPSASAPRLRPPPRLPPPPAPPPALPFPPSRPTPFPVLPASLPAHTPLPCCLPFLFFLPLHWQLLHVRALSIAAYIKACSIMQLHC